MRFENLIRFGGLQFAFVGALMGQEIPPEKELPFKKIRFTVSDAKTGKGLTRGVETIELNDGVLSKNTTYWPVDDEKNIIQDESCAFDVKTLRPRSYSFRNKFSGESVTMSGSGSSPWSEKIFYREAVNKPEVVTPFTWNPDIIIGKTLHHVIVRSWKLLSQGGARTFDLFVPMKRDQFKFRVVKKASPQEDDPRSMTVSLELDNWALRQLAPSMLFYYRERDGLPVLERYEGPTTVVIDNDANRKVIIDFQYEI